MYAKPDSEFQNLTAGSFRLKTNPIAGGIIFEDIQGYFSSNSALTYDTGTGVLTAPQISISSGDTNGILFIGGGGSIDTTPSFVFDGSTERMGLGVASPSAKLDIDAGVLTGSNLPILETNAEWSNVATTFTGWNLNITDTASADGSLLFDLSVNSASQFSMDKNGRVLTGIWDPLYPPIDGTVLAGAGVGFDKPRFSSDITLNQLNIQDEFEVLGHVAIQKYDPLRFTHLEKTEAIGWTTDAGDLSSAINAAIEHPSAGNLSITDGNGGYAHLTALDFNAQNSTTPLRANGTTIIGWPALGSEIAIANAGNGYWTDVKIYTGDQASPATAKLSINQYGVATFADTIIAGGSIEAGNGQAIYWHNGTILLAPSDGVLELTNYARTDFSILQFGGTTSSFPSLKRSGTELQSRLADDSGYATFGVASLHSATGVMDFANGNWNMRMDSNNLRPRTDNAISLGDGLSGEGRWKDAYFSGELKWGSNATTFDAGIKRSTTSTFVLTDTSTGKSSLLLDTLTSDRYIQQAGYDWALVDANGGLQLASDNAITFSNDTTYYGTKDVGLARDAAGLIRVSNGSSGYGAMVASYFQATTNLTLGGQLYWSSSTVISAPSNGNLKISNYTETDFGLLQLGGTSSSFPAIKRSSADLEVRVADDTAYANLKAKRLSGSDVFINDQVVIAGLSGNIAGFGYSGATSSKLLAQGYLFSATGAETSGDSGVERGGTALVKITDGSTGRGQIDTNVYTIAGITASTTQTQGQGALTATFNQVSVCANTNDTVTLPAATAGRSCRIKNDGAQTLQIFPASGDDLGAGVNAAVTLAAGGKAWFETYDGTTWVQWV